MPGTGMELVQVRPVLRVLQLQSLSLARHAPQLGPQLLPQIISSVSSEMPSKFCQLHLSTYPAECI